jgi:hypothetical protein
LIQKGPEGDFQREEALAAIVAAGVWGKKGGGKISAEELAQLCQRGELWQLRHRLFEGGDRRFSKKKRPETVKERGSKTHGTSVFLLSVE